MHLQTTVDLLFCPCTICICFSQPEFAAVHDETAVFELEAMYSGNLYFMCTAYRESENTAGSKGWYLSMSDRGQLTGNGGKGVESQWLMLTEQPPQPNGVVDASGAAVAAVASAVEGNNGSGKANFFYRVTVFF